jgi:flavin-dependent dehydrogenase
MTAPPIPVDGISVMYVPRRTILDKLLVDAAVESGAELEERTAAVDVVWQHERVTGIRVRRNGGVETEVRATVVVGADGKNSAVARSVRAPKYRDEGTLTCSYYSYWSDVDLGPHGNLILAREDWGIASGRTHHGLVLANMSATLSHLAALRADTERHFFEVLDAGAPYVAEALRSGRRVEHFRGLAEIPNFFRQSSGAGWALAGDAGYYRDPITAQGISDAFRDADLLAAAIDDGLGGETKIDDALAGYNRSRDQDSLERFEWTLSSAQFVRREARVTQMMEAIASDATLTQKFVNLNQGLASFGDVVSSAITRIAGSPGA